MRQLRRTVAILCILSLQADFVAHFYNASGNAYLHWWTLYRVWAATSYYFDATLGNDANPCTQALPCQTNDRYDTLVAASACADSFFFKRGEVWTANDSTDRLRITNKPCTSSTRIVLDTYGSGALPIMDGGTQFSSFDGATVTSSSFITIQNIHFRDWVVGVSVLGSSDIIIKNNTLQNTWKECARTRRFSLTGTSGSNSTRILWEGNTVDTCGLNGANGEGFYTGIDGSQNGGVPDTSSNITFIGNDITNTTHELIELKPGVANAVIDGNYFHDVVLGTGGPGAVAVSGSATNAIIRNNRFKNITGAGGKAIFMKGSGQVQGNVIDTVSQAIDYQNTGNNPVRSISNNTIYAASGTPISGSGSNTTLWNQIVWGSASGNDTQNPQFKNAAGGDLSLLATSPAIDSGINCDRPFNGPSCDRGAFETITFASGEVGLVNTTTTIITLNNNLNPAIQPSGLCAITGFTRQEENPSGTWNNLAVSCQELQGTNQVKITHAAYTPGRNQRLSYSTGTGNVTDSALIGKSLNQSLNAIVNQAITDSIGSPPAGVLTQSNFRIYRVPLSGNALDPLLPAGVRGIVIMDGVVIALAQIKCTGATACPTTGAKAQWSWDGSTWFNFVDGSVNPLRIGLSHWGAVIFQTLDERGSRIINLTSRILQDGTKYELIIEDSPVAFAGTTNFSSAQYPGQGFIIPGCIDPTGLTPTSKGALQRNRNAVPNFSLGINECMTIGAMIKINAAVANAILKIRWVDQDGALFAGSPYVPAEIKIVDQQMIFGF